MATLHNKNQTSKDKSVKETTTATEGKEILQQSTDKYAHQVKEEVIIKQSFTSNQSKVQNQ